MNRILVRKDDCHYCHEGHKYYLEFRQDGSIYWLYEGCSYDGSKAVECYGEKVTNEEALRLLQEKRDADWEEVSILTFSVRVMGNQIERLLLKGAE